MNQLTTRTASLSIPKLQEMAQLLINDFQEGADQVLSAVLQTLEAKMSEAEFVAFAEALG
jgi:hypothetical protein